MTASEPKRVEISTQTCRKYETLLKTLQKAEKCDEIGGIWYQNGTNRITIDGQKAFDQAIKMNGNSSRIALYIHNSMYLAAQRKTKSNKSSEFDGLSKISEQAYPKKLELLAKSCKNYDVVMEKIAKSEKTENFVISYDFGNYQMVIDGQDALDEVLRNNGRKMILELYLRRLEKEAIVAIKNSEIKHIDHLDVGQLIGKKHRDRASNDGSHYGGKSIALPSLETRSRYSDILVQPPKKYRLGKKIGEGSLGYVCLAENRRGGTYACKVIQKNGKHSPQEANVEFLSKLKHERIVEYKYIIEPESLPNEIHILMEYMHSGSLKNHIEKWGALHNRKVKIYTMQILEGLEFLHSQEIIHQDLKPANLLLKDTHEQTLIKIADFGSSKFASLKSKIGQQGRTPKYTDPQVSLGKERAGRRSDIWSLGVIVIEMFTGLYPWDIEGEYPPAVAKILETREPIYHRNERTDQDLIDLTKMMMAPIDERPYTPYLLTLPVFEENENSENSDSDYF